MNHLRFALRQFTKAPGFTAIVELTRALGKTRTLRKCGSRCPRIGGRVVGVSLTLLSVAAVPAQACTIFVLTDANRTIFCNNEDWLNPKTRIWFVPASGGCFGCAYVGFDDGWARGGLNTEGLACDWVGGFNEEWKSGPGLLCVRGNPTERLLESCTTVGDAIAFFRKHPEPDFARAKILVADRSGASVIIGARDGKLQIEQSNQSRGFGYAYLTLNPMLAMSPQPTVTNGATILHACVQRGQYATKYSNVFNLKSGEVFLYPLSEQSNEVRFSLPVELEKGGHYYDMPNIRKQLAQTSQPLLINMRRFFLDEFPPIPEQDSNVTHHLRATIEDAMRGTMRPDDYTAELWKEISTAQSEIQTDLSRYGEFVSMDLADHRTEGIRQSYRYRVELEKATLLMHYVLDEQHRIALIHSEGAERKPGADLGGD